MPYDLKSIQHILDGKTLSGLDPDEIEACNKSQFNGYFEWWSGDAYDAMRKDYSHEEMLEIILDVNQYQDVGDFICDEIASRIELAAFLLILLDRFAVSAASNFNSWDGFRMLHQIYECILYISPPQFVIRNNAKKAAAARHSENRSMKQEAYDWYSEFGKELKNDDAAIQIKGLVPISLRTAQDWVSDFRRMIRSARIT